MNVKQVGMESSVPDHAHCILLVKVAGMSAHARTMHSACPPTEHVFVHQVIEVRTAVIFVLKVRLVRIVLSVVSARMQHNVPLRQDDASANQVGLGYSVIDHAMNTSMATTAHNSVNAGTTLPANHRMVHVFVHQGMQVISVMIDVYKACMDEAVSRIVTVIKKTLLVVTL